MKWFQFDTIYVNGSSLTAGGGLELDDIKKKYKEIHNVEYSDEKLVTYGKYVADHFGCNFINEAKSGSGSPRLIRKTYEYLKKIGINNAKKTLFLFEIQDPTFRVDMYCEKVNDYITVNVRYDGSKNEITSIQIQNLTTNDDVKYDEKFFDKEITEEIKCYLEKYHNPITYLEKIDSELVGLFSYLNECGINYYYMFDQSSLMSKYISFYKKNNDKLINIDHKRSINDFCGDNKLTISDELNNFTPDTHPGYFGNKKFSEKLIEFLTNKLKPKLFTFGDSFTQSFKDHFETENPWAVNYKNYKKYVPKNYVDLLSENLGIDFINMGRGGCSNYTIFDCFIDNFKQIKNKDIIIFGWTSESRFRISDDVNNFIDITPFNQHPPQNIYVSKKSTEEIGRNRVSNNVWWKEISNFVKIINNLLPNNKIVHWTWVDSVAEYQDDFWSNEMIEDKKLCIQVNRWDDLEENLKNRIIKCSDVILDFSKNINYDEVLNTLEKYKKVVIINTFSNLERDEQFIKNNLRLKNFNIENHKEECFKHFIKSKKYETIKEETNGVVDDLHYSERGHIDLYLDLLNEIQNGKVKKTIL